MDGAPNIRHLVLDFDPSLSPPAATLACVEIPEPHDPARHTFLAALTTCPNCQAVQAARVVIIDALIEEG